MSDATLRAMVTSTQRNVSQFMDVLQSKVLAIEQDIEETERKLDEVKGAKEMLTELLRHAGFTPPPLVFHAASEGEVPPRSVGTSPPSSLPPPRPTPEPVLVDHQGGPADAYTVVPPSAGGQAIHDDSHRSAYPHQAHPQAPQSQVPPTHPEPSQAEAQPHQRHPALPSNFYPSIRRQLPTISEEGEERQEVEQRVRDRVLRRRAQVHNPLQEAKAAEQARVDAMSHHASDRHGSGVGHSRPQPQTTRDETEAQGHTMAAPPVNQAPRMSAADLSSLVA